MPTYNDDRYLGLAIESILNQTFTNYELIIVDDCSSDNTQEVLLQYQNRDSRIKIFRNQKNLGRAGARNRALQENPTGKYIAIMDSDDLSLKNRFKEQIKYLDEYTEIAAVGTQVINIDENGHPTKEQTYLPLTNASLVWTMLYSVPFCNPSVMMRSSMITKIGKYKNACSVEDAEYWTRLVFVGKFANLPEAHLHYRMPSNRLKIRLNDWKIPLLEVSKSFIEKLIDSHVNMIQVEFIKASIFLQENFILSSKEVLNTMNLLIIILNRMLEVKLISPNDKGELSNIILNQFDTLLHYSSYFRSK